MKPLNISVIQQDIIWESVTDNLAHLDDLIAKEVSEASIIIVLPEMFATGFTMNPYAIAEGADGTIFQWMKAKSKLLKKIICGSIATHQDGAYYNRMIWMMPNGVHYHYDKAHLFGKAGEDKHYQAGQKRIVVSVNGWRWLLIVCYDLRFPVWIRQGQELYDGIICVANWPEVRIAAWDTLLRARAIENQCFVIGCNRVGTDGNGIYHNGSTQIVSPEGEVLASIHDKEGILQASLDYAMISDTRHKLPFLSDRDYFILSS